MISLLEQLVVGLARTPLAEQRTGRVTRHWQVFFDLLVRQVQEVAQMPSPWYGDLARQGQLFTAGLHTTDWGTALTASASTITLYNPVESPVNLALVRAMALVTSGLAGITTVLAYAATLDPVAAIPSTPVVFPSTPALVGSAFTAQGAVYSSCILPAVPTIARMHPWNTYPQAQQASAEDMVAGQLLLAPGCTVTLQGLGDTVGGWLSLTWAEVPR